MTTYVGFSGHRDALASREDLKKIWFEYIEAVWIYGAAKSGFDKQVGDYAKENHIPLIAVPPDYNAFDVSRAPLERNDWIVDFSDVMVFLYDGRKRGGTFHTINYSRKCLRSGKKLTLVYLTPAARL